MAAESVQVRYCFSLLDGDPNVAGDMVEVPLDLIRDIGLVAAFSETTGIDSILIVSTGLDNPAPLSRELMMA
jgi:hypothetical protein